MHRSWRSVVISFHLFVFASTGLAGQLMEERCLRSTIASYPEDQRRPVLNYLDEARHVADDFVRLLAERRYDEMSKLDKRMTMWAFALSDPKGIQIDLADF